MRENIAKAKFQHKLNPDAALTFLMTCSLHNHILESPRYIEDITWWREDMNFMFEWQEQYIVLATRT